MWSLLLMTEPNSQNINVLGTPLESCCQEPKTGFFRDGFCRTNNHDRGAHVVCSIVNKQFLDFTRAQGNDLSSAAPQFGFPGLKEGDRWCLCVARWKQALVAGCAPAVKLEATHISALEIVELEDLKRHAIQ
jgi:uncharacterized protein (DUF2237 family)